MHITPAECFSITIGWMLEICSSSIQLQQSTVCISPETLHRHFQYHSQNMRKSTIMTFMIT